MKAERKMEELLRQWKVDLKHNTRKLMQEGFQSVEVYGADKTFQTYKKRELMLDKKLAAKIRKKDEEALEVRRLIIEENQLI